MAGHTTVWNESDMGSELARFEMERAVSEEFPEDECAFCGSDQEIQPTIVNSYRLLKPRDLPICKICQSLMNKKEVDEYFRSIQGSNPFLWSLIVLHNMRKTNWISRSVFTILKEKREENTKGT